MRIEIVTTVFTYSHLSTSIDQWEHAYIVAQLFYNKMHIMWTWLKWFCHLNKMPTLCSKVTEFDSLFSCNWHFCLIFFEKGTWNIKSKFLRSPVMSQKNDVSPLNFSELLFCAFVKAAKLYIVPSSLNPIVNGQHSRKRTSMSVYLLISS